MKTWLKPGRLIVLALVLIVLAWIARRVWFAPPPPPQVATTAVARADIEDTVLATGTVYAARLVSVGAQVTGEVKHLNVALGDTVRKGQLIAEIDAVTQENTLRTAEAQLQSAEASLRSSQATLRQAELAATRAKALAAIDAGSQSDLELAEAQRDTARANIAVQQAQIIQMRLNADTQRVNLGYTRVIAPMDGTVVAVVTEQGQTVNALQSAPTIIKLAKLDTMTVKAQISEADVPRVKPGMPVYFSLLGEPDKRIEVSLRAVEPGPTTLATDNGTTTTTASTAAAIYYNGIFDVPNPDGKLRINMTAQTTIVLARAKDVLAMPSAGLGDKTADGRYKVRVLQGDTIVDKTVRVGLNNRVQAQVLDGLAAGEKVITSEAVPGAAPSMGPRRGPPPGG